MRLMLVLCLGISLAFLSGCDVARGTPDDLTWLKPIEFSEETKVWLSGLQWPASAYEDFEKIARFNEKLKALKDLK